METETTQRMDSPRRPCLPTVFITRAGGSIGKILGLLAVAGAFDDLAAETLDFAEAMLRKLSSSDSPDSSCSLSMRSVRGRASGLPCSSKLRNKASRPLWRVSFRLRSYG